MIAALDEAIAHEIADKAIPSISYVLFDTNGVLAHASFARAGGTAPRDDALYRIGSITKTFTALAAMREVEAGRLDLDADVSRYLGVFEPQWQGARAAVTLRHLLSHRSGLTREAGRGHYLSDQAVPLAETVNALRHTQLKVAPDGTTYRYSNAGFALVGACIEAASGRSYGSYLATKVLAPLGVETMSIGIGATERARLAPAMMWNASGDRAAPLFNIGCTPAGSLLATMDDLARYGQALLGDVGIVRRATLEAMWQLPDGARTGYALGFMVGELDGHRTIGHGGVIYGYASELMLLPEEGIGIAMVATLDCSNAAVIRLSRYGLELALASQGKSEMPPAPARGGRHELLPRGGEAWRMVNVMDARSDTYAPEFLPTRLIRSGEQLTCVLEEFFPHDCLPLGGNRYRLGPGMYEDEVLEVGADFIRVGDMTLGRLN